MGCPFVTAPHPVCGGELSPAAGSALACPPCTRRGATLPNRDNLLRQVSYQGQECPLPGRKRPSFAYFVTSPKCQ
jgi:hypothetical protein